MKQLSETFESNAFARWLSTQPELLFSKIPIGDTTLAGEEGGKLHAMGVRRGVPDFVIVHEATGRMLWVEMKRARGGVVSEHQKRWLAALRDSTVAHGFKEAKAVTLHWLMGTRIEYDTTRTTTRTKPTTNCRRKSSASRVLPAR